MVMIPPDAQRVEEARLAAELLPAEADLLDTHIAGYARSLRDGETSVRRDQRQDLEDAKQAVEILTARLAVILATIDEEMKRHGWRT